MKSAARLLVPALLATLILAGCEAPANVPRAASRQSAPAERAWIERREAQLRQMGLKDGDASLKAREEWEHFGNTGESYTLYDSTAKPRAEQEKFESDLAKTGRN